MISRRSLFGFALVPLAKPVVAAEFKFAPVAEYAIPMTGVAARTNAALMASSAYCYTIRPEDVLCEISFEPYPTRNTVTYRAQRQEPCQYPSTPNRQPAPPETQ